MASGMSFFPDEIAAEDSAPPPPLRCTWFFYSFSLAWVISIFPSVLIHCLLKPQDPCSMSNDTGVPFTQQDIALALPIVPPWHVLGHHLITLLQLFICLHRDRALLLIRNPLAITQRAQAETKQLRDKRRILKITKSGLEVPVHPLTK